MSEGLEYLKTQLVETRQQIESANAEIEPISRQLRGASITETDRQRLMPRYTEMRGQLADLKLAEERLRGAIVSEMQGVTVSELAAADAELSAATEERNQVQEELRAAVVRVLLPLNEAVERAVKRRAAAERARNEARELSSASI